MVKTCRIRSYSGGRRRRATLKVARVRHNQGRIGSPNLRSDKGGPPEAYYRTEADGNVSRVTLLVCNWPGFTRNRSFHNRTRTSMHRSKSQPLKAGVVVRQKTHLKLEGTIVGFSGVPSLWFVQWHDGTCRLSSTAHFECVRDDTVVDSGGQVLISAGNFAMYGFIPMADGFKHAFGGRSTQ